MKIYTYSLGPVQTNCYLISDTENNCLIIDPGEESDRLINEIEKLNLKPVAILATHGHFDHIGAVDPVRDHFKVPVYIHEIEAETLVDPAKNGSVRYPMLPQVQNRPADHFITEEGMMEVGSFKFEVRHTPGHSPGSVTFVFEEANIAVVGDTLFRGSIGRTDLEGGNTEELLSSIHHKLLSLDDRVILYPGHGQATTSQLEMDSNPFLNGF